MASFSRRKKLGGALTSDSKEKQNEDARKEGGSASDVNWTRSNANRARPGHAPCTPATHGTTVTTTAAAEDARASTHSYAASTDKGTVAAHLGGA